MEASNAGDDESLRRFLSEDYSKASLEREPIEDQITPYQGIRAHVGKLIVRSVKPDGEFRVALVSAQANGSKQAVVCQQAPRPRHVEAAPYPAAWKS